MLRANRGALDVTELREYFRSSIESRYWMSLFVTLAEPPFAASGGIVNPAPAEPDPYRALDDLMATVEMLCPTWPTRNVHDPDGNMLL